MFILAHTKAEKISNKIEANGLPWSADGIMLEAVEKTAVVSPIKKNKIAEVIRLIKR